MGNHDGQHAAHHVVSPAVYAKVLGVLLALTVLTVLVARPVSGFDAGLLNAAIAFAIASVKAGLVLAIFMGLKYDKRLNLVIFLTGVFFLIVMYTFCITDIYTRLKVDSSL